MSERTHALAQHLFGKATIEECDLSEVKGLAQRYPYFAPAQFLLLEKLKQEGSEGYSAQLQKAILYYHDPLQFQYFINSERYYTDISEIEKEALEENIKDATDSIESYEPTGVINEEVNTVEVDHSFAEDKELVTDVQTGDTALDEEPDTEREAAIETLISENENYPVLQVENNEVDDIKTFADKETGVATLDDQAADLPVKLPGLLKESLHTPVKDTGISFEPFHTVDYFASQGIKISQEELPKDKFGKQVKSFTEWLKTMKRLPATQLGTAVDAGTETKVQNMALNSIHDASVWTEAMAEVWVKQGNASKAIEVYNKLSLLNPSKRAYFATKIENLKRS
ncbi:MAG TPA: hypothetical protein VJ499_16100 [Flavisolibacter sp.]|nr:hypothetical protein [Flavisolibacter sp.]